MVQAGNKRLAPPHKEVLSNISSPFIQVITDFASPHAVFGEGKILLVGDALALLRPHTAFSATHAAYDCLMLERYMRSEITLAQWEKHVVRFGRMHWLRSIWYGDFYQRPLLLALVSAAWYWVTVIVYAILDFVDGEPSKFRA